jgi:hypothetical protein
MKRGGEKGVQEGKNKVVRKGYDGGVDEMNDKRKDGKKVTQRKKMEKNEVTKQASYRLASIVQKTITQELPSS